MDLEKTFNDLESNQNIECEEAKKKLVELFTQTKQDWLVHSMMDYYVKTGSARIIEVLVKVLHPHDVYIFDKLAEWLKSSTYRIHALNLFCFVVRKHPTWLFKVEKHRLVKDMLNWLKQLEIEKEIVPLMSALLAIITLLPIIPNLVPTFLNDLFGVFAHLASWNSQNTNRLTEDKLVHLQLGLQMLFHRLYGMFPCNFMAFLTEFIRKEKGAIFQHTIKPLLDTVRLHPMLVTATVETETYSERWKEIQPHDVVVECMRLSLPMNYQEVSNVDSAVGGVSSALQRTAASSMTANMFHQQHQMLNTPAAMWSSSSSSAASCYQFKEIQQKLNAASASGGGGSGLNTPAFWSPYHEIINSNHTPLTPTPAPYMMPMSSATSSSLGVTGCSPPEAAVEATPETTPLKDNRELKRPSLSSGGAALANPLAIRAIFTSSQPSSPSRGNKDSAHQQSSFNINQQSHFNFPDVKALGGVGAVGNTTISSTSSHSTTTTYVMEQELNTRITRVTTSDRRVQQMLHDRNQSQSPFQTIEAQQAKMGFQTPSDICQTPEIDSTLVTAQRYCYNSTTPLSALTATPTPGSTPLPLPHQQQHQRTQELPAITKVCDECNETDHSRCSEGGLQMPTSRSMQLLLAKGIKKRSRMTSYCYNEKSCEKIGVNGNISSGESSVAQHKIRRTKSLSSLLKTTSQTSADENSDDTNEDDYLLTTTTTANERYLQKSPKMLAIASALKSNKFMQKTNAATTVNSAKQYEDKCIQTLDALPLQNDELSLLQMLTESKEYRTAYEATRQSPNEILEQFIARGLSNNSMDRLDPEQFQLLCLQLQYERYRREIHAERNRRLMGRSRDKRSLEMERDRLKEQIKDYELKNTELSLQLDRSKKLTNEKEREYQEELTALKSKYQNELEQNRCLRQANENLQTKLTEELGQQKGVNYELEALRGQVFSLTTELQHAQQQADMGLQCRQELARLEADFIVMGEVQIKCRDKLSEIDNYRARDEEMQDMQDTCNHELKGLKQNLDDKTSQLESARHKIQETHAQLLNNEKVIMEQKRLLKAVKDEYEEKFKALNKKYEVQKTIIMQMEEKFMMSIHKPMQMGGANASTACCSPDTDKTDIASSMERNSPLSTSLASSESLSTSLRSSELRNLQQLVENPIAEVVAASTGEGLDSSNLTVLPSSSSAIIDIVEGHKVQATSLDLASSANTATILMTETQKSAAALISSPSDGFGVVGATATFSRQPFSKTTSTSAVTASSSSATMTHIHPHSHYLQQHASTSSSSSSSSAVAATNPNQQQEKQLQSSLSKKNYN